VNGNGLLDPGESWTYTCETNVPVSTTNIATAEGTANGFNALDYAFATVLVSAPGLPNTGFPPGPIQTITNNLQQGSSGNDVIILQQFLIAQDGGAADQALANIGATGYFGSLTRAALAEFQANEGINPALGNFGAITRAYLSAN
jgi:peptidoglycan hydrolase-like protein with peptidoglycan-binding domain